MSTFINLARITVGVGAVGGIYAYFNSNDGKKNTVFAFTENSYNGTTKKWDNNWDKREITHSKKSKDKNNNEEKEITKPKAVRHIILIRHGQYNLAGNGDKERYLTTLGREQAGLTGKRLKELGLPYTKLVNSSMTRAIETAKIISEEIPTVPKFECYLLVEGAPIPPEPPVGHWKPPHYMYLQWDPEPECFVAQSSPINIPENSLDSVFSKPLRDQFGFDVFLWLLVGDLMMNEKEACFHQFHQDGARIEAAFRKYFYRADPSQEKDSYDILVCHANVIRYFVCRALQYPPEGWLRLSLKHGSITWLSILPSGHVMLRCYSDAGFMPPSALSTN